MRKRAGVTLTNLPPKRGEATRARAFSSSPPKSGGGGVWTFTLRARGRVVGMTLANFFYDPAFWGGVRWPWPWGFVSLGARAATPPLCHNNKEKRRQPIFAHAIFLILMVFLFTWQWRWDHWNGGRGGGGLIHDLLVSSPLSGSLRLGLEKRKSMSI